MRNFIIMMLVSFSLGSCSFETPTKFNEKALEENVNTLRDSIISFKEILNAHKGKTILIDFWASWCADCIQALPKIKQLQQAYPKVEFVFLSVDTNVLAWKRGVKRFKISGKHYNLPKGMYEGELRDFVGLRWIPRYMIIDKEGNIELFKATNIEDKQIIKSLNNSQ